MIAASVALRIALSSVSSPGLVQTEERIERITSALNERGWYLGHVDQDATILARDREVLDLMDRLALTEDYLHIARNELDTARGAGGGDGA